MDLREFFLKKGYPEDSLKDPPLVRLEFGFSPLLVMKDLVIVGDGRPLLVAEYCPGATSSRIRGLVAYARVAYPDAPPPLVLQTNGREFVVAETTRGREVKRGGPEVVPDYEVLKGLESPPAVEQKRLEV